MIDKQMPPINSIHAIVFDFDGVFTDNKVWVDQDGRESVRCDRADGLAFDLLRNYKKRYSWPCAYFILSKESNPVVLERAKKLKLNCHHGVANKLDYLQEYFYRQLPESSRPFSGLVYLGNDLNDLPVMRRAGFAVAPVDAHPLVREVAHRIYPQKGGEGFVRAFVEDLLGINHMRKEELDELIFDR